jgi:dTDP-4-dehydrorhamnose reductase
MKVIILGSNGMVGSMLVYVAKTRNINVQAIDRTLFDVLCDPLQKLQQYIEPTDVKICIINCIGCIPQKHYSEEQFEHINTRFPHELALFCEANNCGLIHISTNCVFQGLQDGYLESDKCDATDVYGKSKALGEPLYGITLRASIIGPERKTSSGLLGWFLKNPNSVVQGYLNQYWNGLTSLQLATCIYDTYLEKAWTRGTFHLHSQVTVSKYQLLQMFKQIFEKEIEIQPYECPKKYYTLESSLTSPEKSIEQQLVDLSKIYDNFMSST